MSTASLSRLPPPTTDLPGLVPEGVEVRARRDPLASEILTPQALAFVADLSRRFEGDRQSLLQRRAARQRDFNEGCLPGFLAETRAIREADWTVAPIPDDLMDRRVEITGPVDRKMIINALNSGANVFLADFEDAHAPTWRGTLEGQVNVRDAVDGTIGYVSPGGRVYRLAEKTATLMVRPRGWHLVEKHMWVDGAPVSASLFDFGLTFFHNAAKLVERGSGPYFYLPKLESHLEARLWNDVFIRAQEALGLPRGTIRATVLVETILAAFEMDEILFELREHSAGLNCGRWDYMFSFIKKFQSRPEFVLPDRAEVTMDRHFLRSYVDLLVRTCHRRGIHAMGGMAAQIPIKNDPFANATALAKVIQDKMREAKLGHDGTWVAHPGLVMPARGVFDAFLNGPNQVRLRRDDVRVRQRDLLAVPKGQPTGAGLRVNVDVGIQYLESWLCGVGCVPIYNLMEDAATAEISRSQVWQWCRHGVRLKDGGRGSTVTPELVRATIAQELDRFRADMGAQRFDGGRFMLAADLFEQLATAAECPEFLTTAAYEYLDS
jgi:malate synthase